MVLQWLRIHLLMQGTWVQLSLVISSQDNLQEPSPIWSSSIPMDYETTGLRKQSDFDKMFSPCETQFLYLPRGGGNDTDLIGLM